MDQRGKPKRDRPRQQSKQQQCWRNVSRFETEGAVKPFLPGQNGNEIKTGERADRREDQHFRDVLFLEVTDFMREHRLEFRPGQLLNQRVEQHDFPEPPETGEERVRMPRTFAAVHQLNALGAKLGSPRQLEQPFAQVAFRQRREFVEQRQNQNRREHAHQELKCQHRAPGPQPPLRSRPLDNFQDEHQQRVSEHEGEQQTFQPVRPPDFWRRGVEPESLFEPELRVPIERPARHRHRKPGRKQKRRHRPCRLAQPMGEKMKRPRQNAAEQNDQQNGGVVGVLNVSEPALGQRIGDGFFVSRLVNHPAKGRRYFVRVRQHVAAVERGQPEFRRQPGENQSQR